MRTWLPNAALAAVALLILALLGWLVRPRPDLDGVVALLDAGAYDEVERRLRDYLRAFPRDDSARLMLAQASVDRPDPDPELALAQLDAIRAPGREWEARLKTIEGSARFLQGRFDLAEAAWQAALRLDPKMAEAGWGLLNLFAIQGRDRDARRLGLRLFEVEPDPHDRVQLLLQLVRHDAHRIAAESLVPQLRPVVAENPDDLPSAVALGRALVRDSRLDEGLALLSRLSAEHPDDREARLALLDGLIAAGRVDDLARGLDALPPSMADDPAFDARRGWLSAHRGDRPAAVRAYRRAWEADPSDVTLAHRLLNAIRVADDREAIGQLGPRLEAVVPASAALRSLYDEIDALPDLGRTPYPDRFLAMAEALDRLGRPEEARAWRLLAGGTPTPEGRPAAGPD